MVFTEEGGGEQELEIKDLISEGMGCAEVARADISSNGRSDYTRH